MMTKKYFYIVLTALLFSGAAYVYMTFIEPNSRIFAIEWDEEVRMTDGTSLVIHMKRTFERRSYSDPLLAFSRDAEISFDAGPPRGKIHRTFEGYDVTMIEKSGRNWFFELAKTTGIPPKKWVNQPVPVLILRQDGTEQAASSWDEVPDFARLNIMPVTPSPRGILPFANSLLTWDTKMDHWKRNPRAAGDDGILIQRHQKNKETK